MERKQQHIFIQVSLGFSLVVVYIGNQLAGKGGGSSWPATRVQEKGTFPSVLYTPLNNNNRPKQQRYGWRPVQQISVQFRPTARADRSDAKTCGFGSQSHCNTVAIGLYTTYTHKHNIYNISGYTSQLIFTVCTCQLLKLVCCLKKKRKISCQVF